MKRRWSASTRITRRRRIEVRVVKEGRVRRECQKEGMLREWGMMNQRGDEDVEGDEVVSTEAGRDRKEDEEDVDGLKEVVEGEIPIDVERVGDEEPEGNNAEGIGEGGESEEVVEGKIPIATEGEIPTDIEGEIPIVVEGEIHVVIKGGIPTDVEGEIPVDTHMVENETEIVDRVDDEEEGTEKVDMEVDKSELSDRPELIEGTKFIVVPDQEPEAEDTPTTARTNRRNNRRDKRREGTRTSTEGKHLRPIYLEDEEEAGDDILETQEVSEGTENEIPQVQENPSEPEEFSPEAEVKRYAKERKRKGKQEAAPLKKKQREASSCNTPRIFE